MEEPEKSDYSDNLERKFRETFSDFSMAPPGKVWENIRRELHHERSAGGGISRMTGLSRSSSRRIQFVATLSAAAVVLVFIILYFTMETRQVVRGHVYAGETRLVRGTAILFRVEDKKPPYDSLKDYNKVLIDENGYFHFPDVEPGRYLLRVEPEMNSESALKFVPSWFDLHEESVELDLIVVSSEDVNADVHLTPVSK